VELFVSIWGLAPESIILKNLQWGLAPHVSEGKDIFLEKDIL
jgi:hypothetical protein